MPRAFPNLQSRTKSLHFYFNSSSGKHKHDQNTCRLTLTLRPTLFVPVSAHHAVSFNQHSTRLPVFNFCFPSHPGVIRPGDTQRVEFIFKSEVTGIKTELWRLNTHPVLLRGASMQVTLRGVALYQDKTADQRLFIEVVYN